MKVTAHVRDLVLAAHMGMQTSCTQHTAIAPHRLYVQHARQKPAEDAVLWMVVRVSALHVGMHTRQRCQGASARRRCSWQRLQQVPQLQVRDAQPDFPHGRSRLFTGRQCGMQGWP